MSEKTKIEWADSTVNFWFICTKVSPGCANCYAETLAMTRMKGMLKPGQSGKYLKGEPRVKFTGAVKNALALNRKPWISDQTGLAFTNDGVAPGLAFFPDGFHRRRIFTNSLSDWLDEEVPIEWLAEMLETIRLCSKVTWILCTKRPELWFNRIEASLKWLEANDCKWPVNNCSSLPLRNWLADWFVLKRAPANIILLASIENQAMADKRIPELIKIPAVCRGLSIEPLLGPVDLTNITDANRFPGAASFDVVKGRMIHHDDNMNWTEDSKIDWLIIGGESGTGARPCNVEWIRSIVQQGKSAGVATFVKQFGKNAYEEAFPDNITDQEHRNFQAAGWCRMTGFPGKPSCYYKKHYSFEDKKGGDPSEWPEDLRVQEWPSI